MKERAKMNIVTWNVQRISTREHYRRKLGNLCEHIQREEWEVVLLSELRADESGMVWMGEEERKVGYPRYESEGRVVWEPFQRWVEVESDAMLWRESGGSRAGRDAPYGGVLGYMENE